MKQGCRRMKSFILSFALTVAMVLGMGMVPMPFMPGSIVVYAAEKELSGSEDYTAQDGDVLTGSTSGTVTIANNAKITLSDVAINGGIICKGTAEITLVGENSVTGLYKKAGI